MTRNFAAKAVHKYMYPGTYNFRDEADGTTGTDIDFVDTDSSTGTTAADIIAVLDGHKKVLRLSDTDGVGRADIYNTFDSSPTYGTIELLMRTTDATLENTIILYSGVNIMFGFQIDADQFKYYDGAWNNVGLVPTDNAFYHVRIDFECTAGVYQGLAQYDFHVYINGTHYGDYNFANNRAEATKIRFTTNTADNGYYFYIDAIGYSWDTDYAIGDNVFWRHYKDIESGFELDDTGTQGTAITFVASVDTAASTVLINEFNEHKKILRQGYTSAVGGFDYCLCGIIPLNKDQIYEWWCKVSDVTGENGMALVDAGTDIVYIKIENSKFRYEDSGGTWQDIAGITPVNDTWYHIKIQIYDEANDTFDLWVDNVQYLDGIQTRNNQGSGCNRFSFIQFNAGDFLYIDAVGYEGTTYDVADNRIFDYNDAYTREDITTATQNVIYSNVLHGWRTATLYSKNDYDHDRVFLQIYDTNSKLAMEAEIINRVQKSEIRTYTLLDKNYDDLASLSSNTFSADDLHDPTDSTCMLKTVLPNVSEIDGDLILVNADTKTDTYSTVTKNYPDGDFLRDISDLSDSCVIIEANGKCHLDDDLASGDSLDFDNAADHSKMTGEPKVNDILDTINYFEIFGAINPDTGERFYKITDNSGDDRKRKWRITNNSFRNQTDLDAYAAKLVAKLVSVKEITINVQGLGAHNMGTLFTYKYDNDIYTIPSAAYYVIYESIDFDTAAATILLSEGIIESSKYAAGFERPQNYSDTDMGQIYETDINTVYLEMWELGGATISTGILLNAVGEYCQSHFRTSSKIDSDRVIKITWSYGRGDAGVDTIDAQLWVSKYLLDGSGAVFINNWTAISLPPANGIGTYDDYTHTIEATDIDADTLYLVAIKMNEAAKSIIVKVVDVVYYIKRSV